MIRELQKYRNCFVCFDDDFFIIPSSLIFENLLTTHFSVLIQKTVPDLTVLPQTLFLSNTNSWLTICIISLLISSLTLQLLSDMEFLDSDVMNILLRNTFLENSSIITELQVLPKLKRTIQTGKESKTSHQ